MIYGILHMSLNRISTHLKFGLQLIINDVSSYMTSLQKLNHI